MRAAPAVLAMLALGTAVAAAQESAPVVATDLVRVVGEHFEASGTRFRFVGTNVAVMHGEAHRAALESTLDAVRDDGLSVIRVWALGERDLSAPDWSRSYAFRIGEDGWVETSFVQLDRVLVEAAARHLRVIIVLANRWSDYGGIPQYLRWSGDTFDATSPDGIARTELGTFFRSERAQALYLAHVEHVIARINSVSGTPYQSDPTILAWELVNEISSERRDAAALTAFVSRAARRIHALDPSHLVSAGHIGYVTSAERRTWREVSSLPEIDFADAHAYPTEHGRIRTLAELDAFVDDHAMLAQTQLHKPLVMGELGFASGVRALGRSRAQLFDRFLMRADRAGIDGVLAWTYVPSTDRTGSQTILADHPDSDSRRVRAVLRAQAARFSTSTGALQWPTDETPLWVPSHPLAGTRRVARPSASGEITFAPEAFAEARFESVGAYDGAGITQIYGAEHGYVVYRFRAPRAIGRAIRVAMRASSELPGRGIGALPDDGSRVQVRIDDHSLGFIDVPPDDAIGRRVSLEVQIDDVLGALLRESRVHTLRFEVDDDDSAHGLCLYGAATGLETLPMEVAVELPGRVEIAFLP